MYENSEREFGTKCHNKEWWKYFDKDQSLYAVLIDPSKNMPIKKYLNKTYKYIKEVIRKQLEIGESDFTFLKNFKYLVYHLNVQAKFLCNLLHS